MGGKLILGTVMYLLVFHGKILDIGLPRWSKQGLLWRDWNTLSAILYTMGSNSAKNPLYCNFVYYSFYYSLYRVFPLHRSVPVDTERHLLRQIKSMSDSSINPRGKGWKSQDHTPPAGDNEGATPRRACYIAPSCPANNTKLVCVSVSPWLCGPASRSSASSWSRTRSVRSMQTWGPKANNTVARGRISVTMTRVSFCGTNVHMPN